MKIQNFKGIAPLFAAVAALGLVTGCQSAEEAGIDGTTDDIAADDGAADDMGADDVALESEGGFPGFGHGFPGGLGGPGGGSRSGALDFLAMIEARQVIPELDHNDHYYGSNGKSGVSFRILRDRYGEIKSVRPRLHLSVCGLGHDDFLDIAGISIHEGFAGRSNPTRSIMALIDEDRPPRIRVTDGCAVGDFRAKFGDGFDARERYLRIDDNPSNFYYLVRCPSRPDGIARGQLSRSL